jgi:hypothetical protein
MSCWEDEAEKRPSFAEILKILENMLEDEDRVKDTQILERGESVVKYSEPYTSMPNFQ